MSLVLDMDGYLLLGELRSEFDRWLEAEGLADKLIVAMRFDEGYVDAECYITVAGKRTRATERRRLPVRTPPPWRVIEFVTRAEGLS